MAKDPCGIAIRDTPEARTTFNRRRVLYYPTLSSQVPRVVAHINPDVLAWARKRAFLTVEEAQRKSRSSKDGAYESWEAGTALPTMLQAKRLADAFTVPLGVLFAPEPPDYPDPVPEMRRLVDSDSRPSPELVKQIRLAAARREVAVDLLRETEEPSPQIDLSASLGESPEAVAMRLHVILGTNPRDWMEWRDEYEALNFWRTSVERLGVLVFQVGMPLSEMRGFALSETPLPVIVINSKDSPRGRIFTLLHELVHIMLGESSMDRESLTALNDIDDVEQFCNRVAARVIAPAEQVFSHPIVQRLGADATWSSLELSRVSHRLMVSDAMLLRRLRELDRISEESFHKLGTTVLRRKYSPRPREGGNPNLNAVKRVGKLFLQLAFTSAYQDKLSAHSLSQIAGVPVKNLGVLESMVQGRSFMFDIDG